MGLKALRVSLHIVIWALIYLLPYLVAYGEIGLGVLFKNPGDVVHAISTGLLIVYSYLNYYTLVPRFYLQKKYIIYALLVMACALVVIWFPNVFQPSRPDGIRIGPPRNGPPRGGPPTSFLFGVSYNVILFLLCTFSAMSLRQTRQVLKIEKEKLSAELSFLKAQINPHFLFNTLNSIYSLAIQKSDDTPRAITQLSELMRYLLKDSNAQYVDVNKELNYISNYIALQQGRLGDTVTISYTAPETVVNKCIAPLILMSFIENAFKHGVNPDQDSQISISISVDKDVLYLVVANKKVTSVNQDEAIGIGLTNTRSRLEHLYSGKHHLEVNDDEKDFSIKLRIELV